MYCAACGMIRSSKELLAYWPVARPDLQRFVCRPSMQRTDIPGCFRELVGPATVHGIALATSVAVAA